VSTTLQTADAPLNVAASRGLHTFAIAAAVAGFGLVATGSRSLALGPSIWLPALAAVSVLTLVLAVQLSRVALTQPALQRAGWIAASLLLLQASWSALSGSLSASLVQKIAPLQHGVLLLLFLSLVYLVVATTPNAATRPIVAGPARLLSLLASVLLMTQTAGGAALRVFAAGTPMLEPAGTTSGTVFSAPMSLTALHAIGSLFTVVLVLASAATMLRASQDNTRLKTLSVGVVLLVLSQTAIGLMRAGSEQVHISLGALLVAAQWAQYFASGPTGAAATPSLKDFTREVIQLTKPRITFMVVLTFAGGLWLTPTTLSFGDALGALLGTVLVVAAANALNMFWEREIDGRMKRTEKRPLPAGRMSPEAALAVGAVLACIAIPTLILTSNGLTAGLGLLAFVSYVFLYTPMKQKSSLALFVGAVPGALPPLMGWTAATAQLDAQGLALFGVLFAWQIPHFLAISVLRQDDYVYAGFKIIPGEFGDRVTSANAIIFAVVTVSCTLCLPALGVSSWAFGVVALALGLPFVTRSAQAIPNISHGDARARWARRLFVYSIIYLTLLFTALAVDKLIQSFLG